MELSRQEYPALLVSDSSKHWENCTFPCWPFAQSTLSPNQAVSVLEERVKLIGKINTDIADWLAVGNQDPPLIDIDSSTWKERRRVEETYVQGLRKLANRRPHDAAPELGWVLSLYPETRMYIDFCQCVPDAMAEYCQLNAISGRIA